MSKILKEVSNKWKFWIINNRIDEVLSDLTAGFFETGAMPVPTKSQNPTICG